jgi:hypothetical protein
LPLKKELRKLRKKNKQGNKVLKRVSARRNRLALLKKAMKG